MDGLPLAEILRTCRAYGAGTVSVFGSRARGDADPNSDLDLLVDFQQPISLFALIRLETELERITGIPVDVVSAAAIKPSWRSEILAEAKPIAA